MVSYEVSEIIPVSAFAYAWRIMDDRWDRLPDEQLQRIIALSAERGEQVTQGGNAFRHGGPFYVNTRDYHVVSECYAQVHESEAVEHWLATLPIASNENLYVSWGEGATVVTDWTTFQEVWDSLWYLDVLAIFDDTREWAVLFGPEEYAAFVERGAADPHSSNYFFEAGYNLIRVRS